MKNLKCIFLVGLLTAFPCFAQTTTTTPPAGNGQGLEQKLQQMTPEQREGFLKNHPELWERSLWHREQMLDKLQGMTPDQRAQFLQNHPNLQQFINNHPQFSRKMANGSEAGAGIKDSGHPRVNEVNQREQNQQNRIAQSLTKGSLAPQEAAKLEKGEATSSNRKPTTFKRTTVN